MFNWPKLSNHFQKLQTQFEKLLQEDLGAKDSEIQKVKSEFTISTDDAMIRGLSVGLPDDESERAMIVFSRLSSFFEIGVFCLTDTAATVKKASNPESQVAVVFLYGQFKAISEKKSISLPSVGPSQTLCSQNDKLWKDLSIFKWIKNERLTSFLVQLDQTLTFILISRLADAWVKIHFEKIHNELLKV